MKEKKISIKRPTAEKRSRARSAKTQKAQSKTPAMVPLMRCSHDPNACPASGSIVALYSESESHGCIVCGRAIRIRGRTGQNGQRIGRVPSHRRADLEARDEGRARAQRLRCKLEHAEKSAREALRRRAPSRAATSIVRARTIAEKLPPSTDIERRLHQLDNRVFVARAKKEQARALMPRDPKRLLRAIVDASGFDVSAVEPDGLIDHISAALPERIVASIARQPSTEWIRRGLEALLRWSKPKNWGDLERQGFAGDRSVMAFIREFPGLQLLRLPDRAYDESAEAELIASAQHDEIPF